MMNYLIAEPGHRTPWGGHAACPIGGLGLVG